MHHVAIMNRKLGFLPKILDGSKTIESRWYVNRVSPWNRVSKGDIVFFKNSGQKVTAKATVENVLQFEKLSKNKILKIINKYGNEIGLNSKRISQLILKKNYVILIFLKNPKKLIPFNINKKGFGIASAWLCIEDINSIKINS